MGMYAFSPVMVRSQDSVSVAYEFGKTIGYDGSANNNTKLLNFYKKVELTKVFAARPEHFFSKVKLPLKKFYK